MPTTYAIPNGRTVFDATIYTGTGSNQNIINTAGFKPDLVWVKSRSAATNNRNWDSVRGAYYLVSNSTAAEVNSGTLGILSNGFIVGTDTDINNNGATYVGWQWQAGQGTNNTNSAGTITSTVSVNASAGFSIVTYTGTGSNATIGHGLGVAPSFIAIKIRNNTYSWRNYHVSLGNAGYVYFNSTDAYTASSTTFNSTSPTSSVFSVGTELNTNASGGTFVAYCWAEIAGFSKFGSYTGNGSSDGTFVYLGFRPKYILIKRTNGVQNWCIQDTSRSTYNVASKGLFAQSSDAEADNSFNYVDILSNGFKLRTTDTGYNGSSDSYIYAAFAENPFKYANAR